MTRLRNQRIIDQVRSDTDARSELTAYIEDTPRAEGEHSPLAWLAIDRALRVLEGKPAGPLLFERHAHLTMLVWIAVKVYGRGVLPLLTTPLAIEGIGAHVERKRAAERQNSEPIR